MAYLTQRVSSVCSYTTVTLSHLTYLEGSVLEPNGHIFAWVQTEPKVRNCWCSLSGGSCMVSFPFWLYCDDVSGNQSKKWSKHHLFLFSVAGLPHSLSQQEYNIHFLCTSNLAPPMEMLDKIMTQLEYVSPFSKFACSHPTIWQGSVGIWYLGVGLCH